MPTEILSSCQHRSTQFQRQVHLFGCLFKESVYQSTKLQFVIQFVQGTGKTFIKETLNQILNKARSDTNKTTKKLLNKVSSKVSIKYKPRYQVLRERRKSMEKSVVSYIPGGFRIHLSCSRYWKYWSGGREILQTNKPETNTEILISFINGRSIPWLLTNFRQYSFFIPLKLSETF